MSRLRYGASHRAGHPQSGSSCRFLPTTCSVLRGAHASAAHDLREGGSARPPFIGPWRLAARMFRKVDSVLLRIPDLEAALRFYRDTLGLKPVWRRGNESVGLKMVDSDTELVLAQGSGVSVRLGDSPCLSSSTDC